MTDVFRVKMFLDIRKLITDADTFGLNDWEVCQAFGSLLSTWENASTINTILKYERKK